MAGFVWADAVSNVPTYSGKVLRLLASALLPKPSGRPLGGLSGVTAGTPSSVVTATATQWTVQPITGVLDVSAAADGATPFAFDQAVTGAMNSADSANPRVDLLYIRHDDPSETNDGSSPAAVIGYAAGVAAASPTVPATPARAIPLARINVPKANNGNPTVVWLAPFAVAAGGIIPCADSTFYPSQPYVGQYVDDAALGLRRWDGTRWTNAGWVNCTLNAGISGTLQVKRVGDIVHFRGSVTRNAGAFPAGSELSIGSLPLTLYAPFSDCRTPVSMNASSNANGVYLGVNQGDTALRVGGVGVSSSIAYFNGVTYPAAS